MLKLTKLLQRRNMSGLYQWNFIADWGGDPTNASLAPELVREPGDMHKSRSAEAATSGRVGISRITRDDRRCMKKNFLVMALAPPTASTFCFFRSFSRILYLRL
jgi:hypothetical protein